MDVTTDAVRLDKLCESVEYHGIVDHLLTPYNYAIEHGIQEEIDKLGPLEFKTETEYQRLIFGRLKFNKPRKYVEKAGVKTWSLMYPDEVRSIGSYRSDVEIQVTHQYLDPITHEVIKSNGPVYREFLKLPVMYGSVLCNTHGMSPEELMKHNEAPDDVPGYFIYNGLEKTPITEKQLNYNIIRTSFARDVSIYTKVANKNDAVLECSNVSDATNKHSTIVLVLPERLSNIKFYLFPFTKGSTASPVYVSYLFEALQVDKKLLASMLRLPKVLLDRLTPTQLTFHDRIIKNEILSDGMNCMPKIARERFDRIDNEPGELNDELPEEQRYRNLIDRIKKAIIRKRDDEEVVSSDDEVIRHLIDNVFLTLGPNIKQSHISLRDDIVFYLVHLCRTLIWFKLTSLDPHTEIWHEQYETGNIQLYRYCPPGQVIQEEVAREHKVGKSDTLGKLRKKLGSATTKHQSFDLLMQWLQTAEVKTKSMKSYVTKGEINTSRGNKGVVYKRTGLVESRKIVNLTDIQSLSRKVNRVVANHAANHIRDIHMSEFMYMDSADTPEGPKLGLNTNLAIHTRITLKRNRAMIQDVINRFTNIISMMSATYENVHDVPIFLNGIMIGYTISEHDFIRQVHQLKTDSQLADEISCFLDEGRYAIMMYCDGGRLIIPRFTKDTALKLAYREDVQLPSYEECLDTNIIEFIDMHENLYTQTLVSLATDEEVLQPSEELPFGSNASDYKEDLSEATGMILHPSAMYGVVLQHNCFIGHNLVARLLIKAQQSRQATGQTLTNYATRTDKRGYYSPRSCIPLCLPQMSISLNAHINPVGNMVLVAIAPTGYTQEDGIQINRRTMVENRRLPVVIRESLSIATVYEENKKPCTYTYGRLPSQDIINKPRNTHDYSDLEEDGSLRLGTIVKYNSCLYVRSVIKEIEVEAPDNPNARVSRIKSSIRKMIVRNEETDRSIYNGESGTRDFTNCMLIDKLMNNDQDGSLKIIYTFALDLKPEPGLKITSDHGQKGTISNIIDEKDMFCTIDGVYPDIIVGPSYMPSRMTVSQPLEGYMNFRAIQEGHLVDATEHTPASRTAVKDALAIAPNTVWMYNKYGEKLKNKVELMWCHYNTLNKFPLFEVSAVYKKQVNNNRQTDKKIEKGKKSDKMAKDIYSAQAATNIFSNIFKRESDRYICPIDNVTGFIKHSDDMTRYETTRATVDFIHLVSGLNIGIQMKKV